MVRTPGETRPRVRVAGVNKQLSRRRAGAFSATKNVCSSLCLRHMSGTSFPDPGYYKASGTGGVKTRDCTVNVWAMLIEDVEVVQCTTPFPFGLGEQGDLASCTSEPRRLWVEGAGVERLGSDSLRQDHTPGPRLGSRGQARCCQVLCLRSPTPHPSCRRGQPKPNSFRTQDRIFIPKSLFFLLFSLLFLSFHLYPSGCKPREAPKYKSQVELKAYGLCASSPPA